LGSENSWVTLIINGTDSLWISAWVNDIGLDTEVVESFKTLILSTGIKSTRIFSNSVFVGNVSKVTWGNIFSVDLSKIVNFVKESVAFGGSERIES